MSNVPASVRATDRNVRGKSLPCNRRPSVRASSANSTMVATDSDAASPFTPNGHTSATDSTRLISIDSTANATGVRVSLSA